MDVNYENIGFIGGGTMTKAIIMGLLNKNLYKASSIYVSYPSVLVNREKFSFNSEINLTNSNSDVLNKCNLIILCVKPQVIKYVGDELAGFIDPKRHLLVSICAGVTLDRLKSLFDVNNSNLKLIRCTLNTAATVSESCSVYSGAGALTKQDLSHVNNIFSCVGLCFGEVKESDIDAAMSLSGAGIAYMYLMCDAMADGAVKMGLSKQLALKMAVQTMNGASQLMSNAINGTKKHPQQLKDEVCSPGGITISGVFELERNGFKHGLMCAIEAAVKRAKELNS